MPGVLPFIPLIAGIGGMVAGNAQNKSNQAAATNAGDAASAQQAAAQQAAYTHQDQAQATALQNLSQYQAGNKSPVQGWGQRIQGPPTTSPASIGGGVLGPNGMPVPGMEGGAQARPQPQQQSSQMSPALLQMIMAMMQQQQHQAPPPQAAPPPPQPQWFAGLANGNGDTPVFRPTGPFRSRIPQEIFQ